MIISSYISLKKPWKNEAKEEYDNPTDCLYIPTDCLYISSKNFFELKYCETLKTRKNSQKNRKNPSTIQLTAFVYPWKTCKKSPKIEENTEVGAWSLNLQRRSRVTVSAGDWIGHIPIPVPTRSSNERKEHVRRGRRQDGHLAFEFTQPHPPPGVSAVIYHWPTRGRDVVVVSGPTTDLHGLGRRRRSPFPPTLLRILFSGAIDQWAGSGYHIECERTHSRRWRKRRRCDRRNREMAGRIALVIHDTATKWPPVAAAAEAPWPLLRGTKTELTLTIVNERLFWQFRVLVAKVASTRNWRRASQSGRIEGGRILRLQLTYYAEWKKMATGTSQAKLSTTERKRAQSHAYYSRSQNIRTFISPLQPLQSLSNDHSYDFGPGRKCGQHKKLRTHRPIRSHRMSVSFGERTRARLVPWLAGAFPPLHGAQIRDMQPVSLGLEVFVSFIY